MAGISTPFAASYLTASRGFAAMEAADSFKKISAKFNVVDVALKAFGDSDSELESVYAITCGADSSCCSRMP